MEKSFEGKCLSIKEKQMVNKYCYNGIFQETGKTQLFHIGGISLFNDFARGNQIGNSGAEKTEQNGCAGMNSGSIAKNVD